MCVCGGGIELPMPPSQSHGKYHRTLRTDSKLKNPAQLSLAQLSSNRCSFIPHCTGWARYIYPHPQNPTLARPPHPIPLPRGVLVRIRVSHEPGDPRPVPSGGRGGRTTPPIPPDTPPPPHLTTACHLHIVFISTNLDFYTLECKN